MKDMFFILLIFSCGIYPSEETCVSFNSRNIKNGTAFDTHVEIFNGSTTREGETVQLKCFVQNNCSDSKLQIEWYKDSHRIPDSESELLTFCPINRKHSGQYECGISIAGKRQYFRSTGYRLNVIYGPSKPVITVLNTTFIARTYPDPLVCNVDCNPPCNIVWMENGTAVSVAYYHWLHGRGAISESDSGTYRCQASNIIASRISDPFVINVSVPPKYLNFHYKTNSEFEHENFTVVCDTSNSCKPPCTYKWWKGRRNSNHSSSDLITDGNILSFSNVLRSDEGYYTCEATNIIGSEKKDFLVEVKYTHIEVKPYNRYMTVNVGDQIPSIRCIYECYPPCIEKDVLKDNASTSSSQPRYMLPQGQATKEDNGVYRCKAVEKRESMEFEVFSDPIHLNVYYTEVIMKPPIRTMTIREGEVLSNVICVSDCNPPCHNLTLYKNEVYQRSLNNGELLVDGPVTHLDTGIYSCQVTSHRNEITRSKSSLSIIVLCPSNNNETARKELEWEHFWTVSFTATGTLLLIVIVCIGSVLRKKYLQKKKKEMQETYEPYISTEEKFYSEVQMHDMSDNNRIYSNITEFAAEPL